ncbi:hypothetical protein [uncultured Parolsenella sp.]|uniref:hypothetical protein n=1 Tax=uncultured Parolsenella sp. TaxID=2083008 RepID=UPI0027D96330|nr:hypothetical protein [uncultured Parolsenella sp.]
MEGQGPEARIRVLESATQTLDERVTAHGREIDKLTQAVTEIRVSDRHRDESLRRIEENQNEFSGKLDALLMKPGSRWEQVVQVALAALVAYALARMGIN